MTSSAVSRKVQQQVCATQNVPFSKPQGTTISIRHLGPVLSGLSAAQLRCLECRDISEGREVHVEAFQDSSEQQERASKGHASGNGGSIRAGRAPAGLHAQVGGWGSETPMF